MKESSVLKITREDKRNNNWLRQQIALEDIG